MLLEFSYTFDEYSEANRVVIRSKPGLWMRWLAWTIVIPAMAMLLFISWTVTIANRATGQTIWPELKQNGIVLAASLWLAFSAATARRRNIRRAWRAQPGLQLRRRVEIGGESLVDDDAQTHTEYKWNAFQRYVESPNLFVLLPTEASLVILPKRAFPSAQSVDDFRRLLIECVTRPAPCFPITTTAPRDQAEGAVDVRR